MYEGRELRQKLHSGQTCLGTWVNFADPCIYELLAGAGYDFLLMDAEHGAMDTMDVQTNLMATKATGAATVVRVAWNEPWMIKRVLDSGAAGVLVPLVRTAEDVRRAVEASLYPPAGIRGFGPRRPSDYERSAAAYVANANDHMVVWVQVEHIDAVNNIKEIVQVPHLDGVFIGSNDLSGSLGLLGQTRHPRVLEAIDRVIAAAQGAHVPMGMAGPAKPEDAYAWLQKGIQFITLGSAEGYLVQTSQAVLGGVKALMRQ
jgi:2-dehydro-3-deoxyglucarate aldolase/4-hydroxy-2-oxoheptanedioate aldolase